MPAHLLDHLEGGHRLGQRAAEGRRRWPRLVRASGFVVQDRPASRRAARIASAFSPKVEACTKARSIEWYTLAWISLLMSSGPDGHEPAAQRLGQHDHVGLDPETVGGQELPRPAHAGLDLVEHQERAVRRHRA